MYVLHVRVVILGVLSRHSSVYCVFTKRTNGGCFVIVRVFTSGLLKIVKNVCMFVILFYKKSEIRYIWRFNDNIKY